MSDHVRQVFTIGHSNHDMPTFLGLLRRHRIEVLVDVRSEPYSKWASQFNKAELQAALIGAGIEYRYSGRQLGGRPRDGALAARGAPDYDRLAESPEFQTELAEVIRLTSEKRVALMCGESDPYECHRERLLASELRKRRVDVAHILADGSISRPEQGSLL